MSSLAHERVEFDQPDDGVDRWWLRAACRPDEDMDAEARRELLDAFYPERGESTALAKQLCAICPVRSDCLEDALRNGEKHGVWGGLSEPEMRKLRRRLAFGGAGVRRARLTHGTAAGFDQGCECGACRVAKGAERATALLEGRERERERERGSEWRGFKWWRNNVMSDWEANDGNGY